MPKSCDLRYARIRISRPLRFGAPPSSPCFVRSRLANPVLDLGCGTGEVARCVLRSHWPVDGLEFVANEARVAHASGVYRAVMRADGTKLPVASAAYGAVYSHSVLEHIPDDLGAVREAARVLQPGGRLLFTVPAPAFAARIEAESGAAALASTNARLGHFHYRALEEWTERLDEHGLTVVASRGHLPAAHAANLAPPG